MDSSGLDAQALIQWLYREGAAYEDLFDVPTTRITNNELVGLLAGARRMDPLLLPRPIARLVTHYERSYKE